MFRTEIPSEWSMTSIDTVSEVKGGKRLPLGKQLLNEKTAFPYIRVTDLENGTINIANIKYLDRETQKAISQYTISSDDLYISIAGTIGLVGEIPETLNGANLTENAAKLCQLVGVQKSYLRYVLNSQGAVEQFQDKMTSSGQPKLALFRIKDCIFPLPPLAEQKVIVEKIDTLLTQVETTKARLERIPEIIKRFRQSVLAAAVSGRLTDEFLQRSTGVFPLKDICVEDRPITYGVIKLGNEDHSGVPCLRTSNIRWLNIETDEVKKISKDISNDYSRTILRGNEVLVNVRGTLGGVSTISNSMIGWNVSREVAVVAVDSLKATDKYIAYVIASDETQRWLKDAQKGVAYVGINLEDLRKLPIRVPTIQEQTEIVRRVEQLFAFADTIEQKANTALERVNNLTQSILAKAFRGELTAEWRAANPDLISGENSAEALLERIKAEREISQKRRKGL